MAKIFKYEHEGRTFRAFVKRNYYDKNLITIDIEEYHAERKIMKWIQFKKASFFLKDYETIEDGIKAMTTIAILKEKTEQEQEKKWKEFCKRG
jgi:hypothetical protein